MYVDAFNVYHSMIDEAWSNHLKWASYYRLAGMLAPKDCDIEFVRVFTALAKHFPKSLPRQEAWIGAIKADGCEVVYGNFKKKPRSCRKCKRTWVGHEEKETDVNIALHVLNDCLQSRVDDALLITNDTDLLPANKMVKSECASINVHVAAVKRVHPVLHNAVTTSKVISQVMVERALMPAEMVLGGRKITRPTEYDPPTTP